MQEVGNGVAVLDTQFEALEVQEEGPILTDELVVDLKNQVRRHHRPEHQKAKKLLNGVVGSAEATVQA